jgi:HSP20 family protein
MQTNNQNPTNSQGGDNNSVRMVPISSTMSQHGTSVSYGIQNGTPLNTLPTTGFNPNNPGSSNQSNWGNTGFSNQQIGGNQYPSVSASQYGLLNSGSSSGTYNNFSNINRRSVTIQPSVDISETSSDIVVSAFVTNGVSNDLSLNVKEDSLTITGSVWTGTDTCIISRTVPLTTSIRAEAVDATLHSGVLEIRLPKTEKK